MLKYKCFKVRSAAVLWGTRADLWLQCFMQVRLPLRDWWERS